RLHVGLVLHALQREAIEVDLGDVAGLQPIATYAQDAVVVGELVLRDGEKRLGLQHLDERVTQRKRHRADEVALRRGGNGGGAARAVAPKGPLMVALPQIIERRARREVLQAAGVFGQAGDVELDAADGDV